MSRLTHSSRPLGKRGRKANVKPAKGFTRQMKGGPAAHKETVRRAKKAEERKARQQKAWDLLTAGCTFKQIGNALGVSDYTAWHDCVAVLESMSAFGLDEAMQLAQANHQIDAVIRANWAKKGQPAHDAIIIRALERKARLNGTDRERKDAYPLEEVVRIIRVIRSVYYEVEQDIEKRRLYAAELRRKLPPALAPPIDVTAKKPDGDES